MNRFRPTVRKNVLFLMAGLVWGTVGMVLIGRSRSWLVELGGSTSYALAGLGILLGLCIHSYGFSRIAGKNIARIRLMDEDVCFFAFFSWKSCLIVLVMVTIGSVLRHSSVPKEYMSVLYAGIGSALMLSSVAYLNVLIAMRSGGRK